jgi:hypothetical protein
MNRRKAAASHGDVGAYCRRIGFASLPRSRNRDAIAANPVAADSLFNRENNREF